MILRRLNNWLWEGTLEPPLEPLELLPEVAEGHDDVLGPLSNEVARLVRQIEAAREAYERRRAAEAMGDGSKGPPVPDNMRQFSRSILPALDALDRIIDFGDKYDEADEVFRNWLTAVKGLRTRLHRTLEGIGLVALSSVGMEVDLNLHDVVAVVPAGEFPPNTVVAEQQKGYYFKGKLLRDAKVVVAQ